MNKDKFLQLHKQYSLDTAFSSSTKTDHPAYVELAALKNEWGIVWALERLKDSIGHDVGDVFDHDNDPWLSTSLLGEYTNGVCWATFPAKHIGKLDKLRKHVLDWAKKENYI